MTRPRPSTIGAVRPSSNTKPRQHGGGRDAERAPDPVGDAEPHPGTQHGGEEHERRDVRHGNEGRRRTGGRAPP